MGLIKLDYAVLAILANDDLSGYDITNRLREIWKTTHSRIYPVLSKLEKLGLVEYRYQEQNHKPDKKIYKITGGGIETVKQWMMAKSSLPAKKDEGLLKIMCLHLLDLEHRKIIIKDRIKNIKKEKEKLDKVLKKMKEGSCNIKDAKAKLLNIHIINEASESFVNLEIIFSEWLLYILDKKNITNYSNYKFTDYLNKRFAK